ncbi:3-isopropylmalate dehydrogenase [Lysinibacillus sphaericus]
MEKKITVLPGDGIRPEVVASAIRVLQVIGKRFNHTFHLGYGTIGGAAIDQHNNPLPDETIEMCESSDAILLGAVGENGTITHQNYVQKKAYFVSASTLTYLQIYVQ